MLGLRCASRLKCLSASRLPIRPVSSYFRVQKLHSASVFNCSQNSFDYLQHKAMAPKKVCILGSGNWGSTIACLVGENAAKYPDKFVPEVNMWVFEEMVNGEKLTDIINTRHENVKYLPGIHLPENVIAIPDVVEAASTADIIIFVIPHQFIKRACGPLKGNLKPGVEGISLVKGFAIRPGGGIELITEVIRNELSPHMRLSVLMGANLAPEVARGMFCETTIGCTDKVAGATYKLLIETQNFRVTVVSDAITVEMCGALKNIVAVGAGFVDGLKLGDNTKAAVIRIGLMEMVKYVREFGGPTPVLATFFESCGVADLVTTCYGGRNRKVAEAFVLQKKSIAQLEEEMLNGQKLQGPETAMEVNHMLRERNLEDQFPLFTAVHRICLGELQPEQFIDCLRDHPENN